eukprot:Tbor_TRINITY_DN8348_c0_g1::TRINITY_DN8348_c0_g1_i1::g.21106::m.21106
MDLHNSSSWAMYNLPPFYTRQPVAATFQRQCYMWAEIIYTQAQMSMRIGTNSTSESSIEKDRKTCPFASIISGGSGASLGLCDSTCDSTSSLKYSPLFFNADLNRSVPPSVIRRAMYHAMELYPGQCITNMTSSCLDEGTRGMPVPWIIVFLGPLPLHLQSQKEGAPSSIPRSPFTIDNMLRNLLQWVLEEGGGLTTHNMVSKGVVATIDELVEGDVLRYGNKAEMHDGITPNLKLPPPPPRETTEISYESVLRILIGEEIKMRLSGNTSNWETSPLVNFKLTPFNLDGSDRQPFDGIKFGGS